MKLTKRLTHKLHLLVLALMLSLSSTALLANDTLKPVQTAVENSATVQTVRLQDDFYEAVNRDWLNTAQIKPGYSSNDTFTEVSDLCTEQLQSVLSDLIKNEAAYSPSSTEGKMLALYHNYLNTTLRNQQGMTPIKSYLTQIKNISSLQDITSLLSSPLFNRYTGLYNFGVSEDLKDSTRNSLYLSPTSLLLDDSDYYTKPNANTERLKTAQTNYLNKMLILAGYSKDEAAKKVTDAYKLDSLLASSMIGQEAASKEANLYEKLYNPYTLNQLNAAAPHLHLDAILKSLGYKDVSSVIVQEPDWLTALDKIYTEENVPLMRNYMEIKFLCATAGCLSDDFEKIANEYSSEISGSEGTLPKEQQALNAVSGIFSDAIGKLYVEKYFTPESKADVEELVHEIISTYKKKITAVDWMTDSTKNNALKKLDAMTIKIGYPSTWKDYSTLNIKSYADGSSLVENSINITLWSFKENQQKLGKPVDKTIFVMPPQTVNACYNPSANDITFPAAILQSPFYDLNRKREANLGSIGVVIAHEISHAFDTNGANFDENGNIKSWWTSEDYAKFQEKTNAVRDFYSQITTDDGEKVNGDLTVGENIADITAVSCMLDILKEMPNADYDTFFRSWAATWRIVSSPEYRNLLLQSDVHSPNKVRVNAVLQQFDEFYDTYHIAETDKMYIKPENRIKIY